MQTRIFCLAIDFSDYRRYVAQRAKTYPSSSRTVHIVHVLDNIPMPHTPMVGHFSQ